MRCLYERMYEVSPQSFPQTGLCYASEKIGLCMVKVHDMQGLHGEKIKTPQTAQFLSS